MSVSFAVFTIGSSNTFMLEDWDNAAILLLTVQYSKSFTIY
jgi:hypothetical protein